MSSILRRSELPLAIVAVSILSMFMEKFLAPKIFTSFASELKTYAMVVAAFTAYVSLIGLARFNLRLVSRRTPGRWIHAVAGLITLVVTVVIGLGLGETSQLYGRLYLAIISPGGWAFSGAIIFYVSSSCWRVFKMRNVDTSLMLIMTMLVCLAQAPIGGLIWSGWIPIRSWLDSYVSASVSVSFNMGMAVGSILLGIRILIGQERRYIAASGS